MIYLIVSVLLILIDQISKILVQNYMYREEIEIISNIFSFTYVENYGAAWGVFSEYDFILKILPPLLVLGILIYLYKYRPVNTEFWAGTFIIGGAIGNFIDRIRLGYVIDFFDFKVWPVFNFADICIVFGCFLMILNLFRKEENNGN